MLFTVKYMNFMPKTFQSLVNASSCNLVFPQLPTTVLCFNGPVSALKAFYPEFSNSQAGGPAMHNRPQLHTD